MILRPAASASRSKTVKHRLSSDAAAVVILLFGTVALV